MTPIGKITILKSLIISKFIHVFSILPIPENFIKMLTSTFFKFLWSNKPDKIKRGTLCSSYLTGGLKMIKLNEFIKSLKVCWIRRIVLNSDSQWISLFHEMYGSKNMFYLETMSLENIKNKMTNVFWIEVIKNWQLVSKKFKCRSNDNILSSCIWYNQALTKDPLYLPSWYKNGISCIGDIVDDTGKVESIEKLKNQYGFNINILDYYRVRQHVQNYVNKKKFGSKFQYARPVCPLHLQILIKSKKGCQDFYKLFLADAIEEPTAKTKWEALIDLTNPEFWKTIYKVCFKSTVDNDLKWFQCKVINNILATKHYLHKVKLSENDRCSFCNSCPENVSHLLSQCEKTKELWKNIEYWISIRTGIIIRFTETMRILGYTKYDENFWPINFILIKARYYIYSCSKANQALNIFQLQRQVKAKYQEEKLVREMNSQGYLFDKRWSNWQSLFFNI